MKKSGKHMTIARRSLRRMVILGVVLILATCIAAGSQFLKRNIDIYEDFAFSYAKEAATFIQGEKITAYLLTGKKDDSYKRALRLLQSAAEAANIRYFYVVVPTEEDLIYIWDTCDEGEFTEDELKENPPNEFLQHDEYLPGEKEALMKVMRGEGEEKVIIDTRYQKELLATAYWPVRDKSGNITAVAGVDMYLRDFVFSCISLFLNIALAITLIFIVSMTVYYRIAKQRIINPVLALKKATEEISGNLASDKIVQVDVHTGDELETLARSFEEMDRNLKGYIRENAAITAEKERISTELELARRIQADMLPNVFPPFPERTDFDIYARMKPAREVGGDFYDFFLIDHSHLGLVIADVSGKGIPAALFMMMSKILLQNFVLSGHSPKEVLELLNSQICKNNREEMFVTVWLGILDLNTGILTASNAGHEYPFIKRAAGNFEMFRDPHGFVAGGMEEVLYKEYTVSLEPGSKLFLYTDGVPEAANAGEEMFGTERLLNVLNRAAGETPAEILDSVENDVNLFAAGAPQFDDMTMLCIMYNGRRLGFMKELTVEAKLENLEQVIAFVDEQLEECGCSIKKQMQIDVAVEEIFVNIANYAYVPGTGNAVICFSTEEDPPAAVITFTDRGIPFDPLAKPDPDVTLSAEERKIGGMGIFMVKKIMDDIRYRYEDGQNILTLRKYL